MKTKQYNFKSIEEKWQKAWEKKKIFQVKEGKKNKCYVLEQFAYPSGSGLHMGHSFVYTLGDICSRFKIMNGFNVLHPVGYDSLGLPAENAAIRNKTTPKKYTEKSINYFSKQQKALGLSYDWSRLFSTHEPKYYKWDQWIFLKMFENGLAYRKKAPVNFCRKCDTVLANEQVHNGKCEYHPDTDVAIKHLEQWFLKITDYAEELANFESVKEWPALIKKLQKNWIGKSYGTEIEFKINDISWPIFTTRPDTIFGVTFMVVSTQHSKLMELVTKKQKKEIKIFLNKIKSVSEKNIGILEKEGVFTGSYAVHPLTKEKIPIYVGNFVLADYGSGMVMAVPAHDQRDFEFAKKYRLEIKEVIKGGNIKQKAYVAEGTLINSKQFNGLNSKKAIEEITRYLERKKIGKKTIQYKLKDWLISRQRYWGTPIPIVYCDNCGIVPVPEKDLPVKLPEKVKFGKGNPLLTNKMFVDAKCPKCKCKARRETDTMDTFANSSWYYLRFTDPKNNKKIFDERKADYWVPIDIYVGGKEHACMHDIYFRFYHKFLRDLGLLKTDEPAKKLFVQGIVHGPDGNKMSKSLGNVIDPLEIILKYGADTLRLFLISTASPDKDILWSDKAIQGSFKFIKKVYDYFQSVKIGKSNEKTISKYNSIIKDVANYIENFNYNLAVISLRELFDSFSETEDKKILQGFLKMLHPICPHITEEFWHKLGNKNFISLEKWPKFDKKKINKKFEQEEGIVKKIGRDINNIKGILKINHPKVYLYAIPSEVKLLEDNKDKLKTISGANAINIFSVADKNKHDPEGKSKKAKPEKPAIYVE